MRIAFLTPEFITEKNWHGGLANYLKRVTEGLSQRGHDVRIFALSDRSDTIQYKEVVVYKINFNSTLFKFLDLLTFGRITTFLKSVISAFQVCREFKKIDRNSNFDIVQSASYSTLGIFLYSPKDKKRLVTRISSISKLYWGAYGKNNKIDLFLVNWLELKLLKKSAKSYSPSLISKRLLEEESNIRVDFLEPPYQFNKPKEDNSFFIKKLVGKKYFLFFGSLGKLKGVDFIAENIREILKLNKAYYFVFIGKDMGYKGGSMKDFVKEKAGKYSEKIVYSNSLEHPQLFPVIENAIAVVLPSRIDNLPNTLIESMSLGKIVVGTYDGGFDQLIENEVNGFLLDFGNNQRLLKILREIANMNSEEISGYEKRAKERVFKQLNFENRINDLENYFKDILR